MSLYIKAIQITMSTFKQNTRFDCLKDNTSSSSNYSSERFSRNRDGNSRGFSSRNTRDRRNQERAPITNPGLFNLNENSFGNYINLETKNKTYVTPAQKNREKYTFKRRTTSTKSTVGDISDGNKFPTLPNLKKKMKETFGLDYSNVKTAESIVKEEVKKPATFEALPDGWVKLKKEDNVLPNPENNLEDEVDNNNIDWRMFNYQCGIACYHTLKHIQRYRDEHIETFGASSEYYEKSDLLDSYISDSDVEYSESEDDQPNNLENDLDDDY